MPPKMKFQEGEKVLCFHGPLLYEAKCVKAEMRDKAVHYFIHYNGWNKNWDEWVPESRVLKFNDSGVQKQKELLKAHVQMGSKRNKTKGKEKEKDSTSGDKKQKAKGKDKEDDKDKDKERSSTPTVEKTAKQKARGKDKEKEDDKEKERSSTPTVEKLTKQKGRGKDKEEEKERSSRSSTPTSDRLTSKVKAQQHGMPSGAGLAQEAPASTTATPITTPIDQKRKRRAEQGTSDTPSSMTLSQEPPTSTTATPTATPIDQKRKRRAEQTITDTPTSSVDSSSSATTETKPRKRGRPEQTPVDSPQPSSQLSDSASLTSTPTEQKRKRVRGENTIESEESYLTKIEVKIKIPEELKPWLVDDWDLITRQKHLLSLPCHQTVEGILEEYVKVKTAKNSQNKDPIVEVTEGIKEYFNVMLGTQLLYKFERPQYGEIMKEHPDKPMSSIYGAIHLLRLFVKLGGMLAYTALDEKSIQLLQNHIHDFLTYMVKNTSTLFSVSDYQVAAPDYHRKAI